MLPRHSHDVDYIEFVLEGEVHHGNRVLSAGAGVYRPAGAVYTYSAGPNGATIADFRAHTYYRTPLGRRSRPMAQPQGVGLSPGEDRRAEGQEGRSQMLLDGRSAVVTGAGSGVGRASARLFAAEGAKVVCADVQAEWVKETVRLIEAAGGIAVAQSCDVAREDDVAAAIAAAVAAFGRLDIMVNNAGISTPRPGMRLGDHTSADVERLFSINFGGVFHGCKHAVRQFKAQGGGGVIVNTGSVAGMVGWGGTVYGASKGAVNQLTKGVAIECAPDGIRVNAICPAAMPGTNFMVPGAREGSQGAPEQQVAALGAVHPLGRPITAEDCAAAALFLASDQAANITGVLLAVDGGYVAR